LLLWGGLAASKLYITFNLCSLTNRFKNSSQSIHFNVSNPIAFILSTVVLREMRSPVFTP
jgi:hypothetical protein